MKFYKGNKSNNVVVVLPYVGRRVLMQLRDFKTGIAFPGKWGFFSGSIEDDEKPEETARRELFEEIGYRPEFFNELDRGRIPELDNLISYSYICPLLVSVKELALNEGFDLGLFTLKEICSKQLFSQRANRYYPIINHPYIEYLVKKLMDRIKI